MNKTNYSSLFKTSLVAALLAGTFHAQAAGLGKLTVYSAIGQPLSAEMVLTASADEINSISAKLASHNAFRDAGIEFMPALTGLRFNVVKSGGGQPVIRLSTDTPLNEPFLHFLVELNWATGRMVREYTFLLDPPEMVRANKPASVVAPAIPFGTSAPKVTTLPAPTPKAKEVSAPASSDTPASAPAPAKPVPAATAAKPAPVAQTSASEYRVKSGDTLGMVAIRTSADKVNLDQMLVALFNANRDAFDGGNMNRLRAGKILRVPDAAESAAIGPAEARTIVLAQAADFNAYRRRLAESVGSAPAVDSAPQQQASGKIRPQVEAKAPAAPVQDKLEVSRTEAAKSAQQAKALEEELIARDRALREAAERIAHLEKNLENLKRLAELKSQAGAQLQQQAKAATELPPAAPALASAPVVDKMPEIVTSADKPAEVVATAPVAEKSVESVPAPSAAPVAEKVATEPVPAPKKPAVAPPPPAPEPESLFESVEIMLSAGLAALLGLGYVAFAAMKRRRQKDQEDRVGAGHDEPGAMATLISAEQVVPAASIDSPEVSILGDFSDSGALTTEENVDPVAEADVLMAYGRDAQAEEILQEGLKSDPTRPAIYLKLLELYAQGQKIEQFELVSADLFSLTNGQGEEWGKALALAGGLGLTHGVLVSGVAQETAPADDFGDLPPAVDDFVSMAPEAADGANSTVIIDAVSLAPVESSVAAEDNGLDFDLDLGSASSSTETNKAAEPASASAEEVMSLDFDFDLGTTDSAAATPTVDEPLGNAGNAMDFAIGSETESLVDEPGAETAPVLAGNEVDFDIDLGGTAPASDALAQEDANTDGGSPASGDLAAVEIDFDLDLDGGMPADDDVAVVEDVPEGLDLAAISLDLEQPALEIPKAMDGNVDLPEVVAEESSLSDLKMPELDEEPVKAAEVAMPDFDLDLGMDADESSVPSKEVAPVAKPAIAAVDLPDINLSLDTAIESDLLLEEDGEEMDLDLGSLGEETSIPGDSSAEPDDPEVATKLELAQAYEEMGDRDGARELLQEVLNEGSAAQRATAQSRLDQLSA